MQLAIKIDVDTRIGLREGVPRLLDLLRQYGVKASFFVSFGPDHSGRAIRRIWRPTFLLKMLRTNPLRLYGIKTLLSGTLLPSARKIRTSFARSWPPAMNSAFTATITCAGRIGGAGVHFPAVHLQPYYRETLGYRVGDCPNAEKASERILSLPLFPRMDASDVCDVVATVAEILDEHRRD